MKRFAFNEGAAKPWHGMGSDLRQLRLPCVPKRQVGHALFHFASFTVCPLAFFPNPVGLVMVTAQIKGRVHNREENNREYRDADRSHARLPPKVAALTRCRPLSVASAAHEEVPTDEQPRRKDNN